MLRQKSKGKESDRFILARSIEREKIIDKFRIRDENESSKTENLTDSHVLSKSQQPVKKTPKINIDDKENSKKLYLSLLKTQIFNAQNFKPEKNKNKNPCRILLKKKRANIEKDFNLNSIFENNLYLNNGFIINKNLQSKCLKDDNILSSSKLSEKLSTKDRDFLKSDLHNLDGKTTPQIKRTIFTNDFSNENNKFKTNNVYYNNLISCNKNDRYTNDFSTQTRTFKQIDNSLTNSDFKPENTENDVNSINFTCKYNSEDDLKYNYNFNKTFFQNENDCKKNLNDDNIKITLNFNNEHFSRNNYNFTYNSLKKQKFPELDKNIPILSLDDGLRISNQALSETKESSILNYFSEDLINNSNKINYDNHSLIACLNTNSNLTNLSNFNSLKEKEINSPNNNIYGSLPQKKKFSSIIFDDMINLSSSEINSDSVNYLSKNKKDLFFTNVKRKNSLNDCDKTINNNCLLNNSNVNNNIDDYINKNSKKFKTEIGNFNKTYSKYNNKSDLFPSLKESLDFKYVNKADHILNVSSGRNINLSLNFMDSDVNNFNQNNKNLQSTSTKVEKFNSFDSNPTLIQNLDNDHKTKNFKSETLHKESKLISNIESYKAQFSWIPDKSCESLFNDTLMNLNHDLEFSYEASKSSYKKLINFNIEKEIYKDINLNFKNESNENSEGEYINYLTSKLVYSIPNYSESQNPCSNNKNTSLKSNIQNGFLLPFYKNKKIQKKIPKAPFKVLDAPQLKDDFYLHLIDWSQKDFLAVGLERSIYIWEGKSSNVVNLHNYESEVISSISWIGNHDLLAVGLFNGKVDIWDPEAHKIVNSFQEHSDRIGVLAPMHQNNSNIFSSGSQDKSILTFDLRIESSIGKCCGHNQEICGMKWSPDDRLLASGGNDNKLFLWNVKKLNDEYERKFNAHTSAIKAIDWSPHKFGFLLTGGGTQDRTIKLWNTQTMKLVESIDTASQVCNIGFSKSSHEFVSTHGYSDNFILVWDSDKMEVKASLKGHKDRVIYLSVGPDGEKIVTGAGDETIRFWDVFENKLNQEEEDMFKTKLNIGDFSLR